MIQNAPVLRLGQVLTPEEIAEVRSVLTDAPFRDGKLTAGSTAKRVKSNLQADRRDEEVLRAAGVVRAALDSNDVFRRYCRPARWAPMLFSRYEAGDAYGNHVDDPLMMSENGRLLRTDLSFTLFLSDPGTYEGGELVVDGRSGSTAVKLPAGALVAYPSGALHHVNPVTTGERVACVGWLQSYVRRDDQRELLFDLGRVKAAVTDEDASLVLDKAMTNLMRMWADT